MAGTRPSGQRTRREHEGEGSDGDDGTARSYGDCPRQELLQRAHELDVGGRAAMTKPELIDALRDVDNHGKSRPLPRAGEMTERTDDGRYIVMAGRRWRADRRRAEAALGGGRPVAR
jgi:hypothetical protein